jgi:hypothetical protein
MSEILESYNFRSVGRGPTYPYDSWFDGQIWKLTKGFDFECQPSSLRQAFYAAARRRGIKVRVSVLTNGDVIVQRAGG